MFRKLICLLLALALVAAPLLGEAGTVYAAQTAEEKLWSAVETQIRTFADSIDQANADDNAAIALANHGMFGGGKTLSLGAKHALTATVFNSELFQVALADSLAAAIKSMHTLDLTHLPYAGGNYCWYGTDRSSYDSFTLKDDEVIDYFLVYSTDYTGKRNEYDKSMDWMVANMRARFEIKRTKVTSTEATYSVKCKVYDRFDFSTSSSSGFKNLISGIGAKLFKEFDWEATVSFNLTVPYTCNHSFGSYRYTYDATEQEMMSVGMDESVGISLIRRTAEDSDETTGYYYELDQTLRLYHNKAWVLEYDIQNPEDVILTAFPITATADPMRMPCLYMNGEKSLFLWCREYIKTLGARKSSLHYYGTRFDKVFSKESDIYTLRLENEIHPGSNMIYLTVINKSTGKIILESIPMDDYYLKDIGESKATLRNESSTWVSGKDLFIRYIGSQTTSFSADHFELRVWENGEDGGNGNYFTSKVTKPTCTAQGYTTYTCSCCGYSYKGDKVKATGHTFNDWAVVTPATCTENGEEQRKCKNCDVSETRTVEITGHNYENHVCTHCGDALIALGDVDTNGNIDVDDVLALLWNVLFPEDYPIEVDADFDHNGITDVDDVLTLLWHVLFPEDYPL